MKFGVREICDVVLKAKANQKIGNKIFYKNEPVIYFDTLKTSSMEGAATTVYAQGGRGNARLAAWEGERTITFTMEDALISPAGFAILSGAGLIDAGEIDPRTGEKKTVKIHTTEQTDLVTVTEDGDVEITLVDAPYQPKNRGGEDYIYVMLMENGEVVTEPFIPSKVNGNVITLESAWEDESRTEVNQQNRANDLSAFYNGCIVLVDYYVERENSAKEISISADKFGGNYYLEASTLFRNTEGTDMPAEFIIPNCKIQSNFTFTMASSGDPSTFTFTMDAFPDYTRFDKTKKVLAAIQVIEAADTDAAIDRVSTRSIDTVDHNNMVTGERPFAGFPKETD